MKEELTKVNQRTLTLEWNLRLLCNCPLTQLEFGTSWDMAENYGRSPGSASRDSESGSLPGTV